MKAQKYHNHISLINKNTLTSDLVIFVNRIQPINSFSFFFYCFLVTRFLSFLTQIQGLKCEQNGVLV